MNASFKLQEMTTSKLYVAINIPSFMHSFKTVVIFSTEAVLNAFNLKNCLYKKLPKIYLIQ